MEVTQGQIYGARQNIATMAAAQTKGEVLIRSYSPRRETMHSLGLTRHVSARQAKSAVTHAYSACVEGHSDVGGLTFPTTAQQVLTPDAHSKHSAMHTIRFLPIV